MYILISRLFACLSFGLPAWPARLSVTPVQMLFCYFQNSILCKFFISTFYPSQFSNRTATSLFNTKPPSSSLPLTPRLPSSSYHSPSFWSPKVCFRVSICQDNRVSSNSAFKNANLTRHLLFMIPFGCVCVCESTMTMDGDGRSGEVGGGGGDDILV